HLESRPSWSRGGASEPVSMRRGGFPEGTRAVPRFPAGAALVERTIRDGGTQVKVFWGVLLVLTLVAGALLARGEGSKPAGAGADLEEIAAAAPPRGVEPAAALEEASAGESVSDMAEVGGVEPAGGVADASGEEDEGLVSDPPAVL